MNSVILENLETLKILTFWNIVKSNNVELLDKNYFEGKKYSEKEISILSEQWVLLYDEFSNRRTNKSGKFLMKKNYELAEITLKLDLLHDMQNRLILLLNMSGEHLKEFRETRRRQILNEFKSLYPKVKINIFYEIEEILLLIQQVIKSQNNIFTEKSGVQEKNIDKQIDTIHYVISVLGNNLGYNLDPNTLTCEDFLSKELLVERLSKSVKNKK